VVHQQIALLTIQTGVLYKERNVCHKIHIAFFKNKSDTEMKMAGKRKNKNDLIGTYKEPDSFHGYCKGPGNENYIGLNDTTEVAPAWQTVCESTAYLKPDCTCTNVF
jgi:hypothetical protein